jgi:hypothetical protein
MAIIIALIIALIIIVVAVSSIQQHKAKQEKDKRIKAAKQKAIMDESDDLMIQLANLPANPDFVHILNRRSLNAAKIMSSIIPESKPFKRKIDEIEARLKASQELSSSQSADDTFILPDNEQQLVSILQCIKKLRNVLKSENSKGVLDAQTFTQEDQKLDAMQLTIGVESILKRGKMAYDKEMLGSARQYFEKALQTLLAHPLQSEYITNKKAEIGIHLENITEALQNTNAKDAARKAKDQENDLDMLFTPKKKW